MAVFKNSSPIVTDGLVLYLDAANLKSYPTTGTTWADLSGTISGGTLTNGPIYDSSNGGSIVFDGIDDYVDCGLASNIITNTSAITVESWVKTNVINSYKKIITTGVSNDVIQGVYFSIGSEPLYKTYLGLKLNGSLTAAGTPYNLLTTSFNHVLGTYDGSNIKLYVNGVLLSTQSASGTIGTGGNFRISGYWNGNENWYGNIGVVRIYNKALTSNEVIQNYNATKQRFNLT